MEFINETRCNERTVLAMNRASIRATPPVEQFVPPAAGRGLRCVLLRAAARLGFPSWVGSQPD